MKIVAIQTHQQQIFINNNAENEARAQELNKLKNEKRAVILMETPYRLKKLLSELSEAMPLRRALLTCDLTQETEVVVEGLVKDLSLGLVKDKAEFMLLLFEVKS